jgi:hypothetical protein
LRDHISWKVKAPIAAIAGIVFTAVVLAPGGAWPWAGSVLASIFGLYAHLAALVLGMAAGWFVLPLLGYALLFLGGLIVWLITLGIATACVAILYAMGAWFFGWPPFQARS